MKNKIGFAVAMACCIMGCNRVPNKDVKAADQRLTEANRELKDAKQNKDKAIKAQTVDEWNKFKNESDSSIATMQNDLKNMEVKLVKTNTKENEQLRKMLVKVKRDLTELRNKLYQRNISFVSGLGRFNYSMYEKNQSFKREFEHDIKEMRKSINDLFKNNTD